jgi:hypothetical protein
MDNCLIQTRIGILTTLRERNVNVITFWSRANEIFHALDLSLLGVLNKKM